MMGMLVGHGVMKDDLQGQSQEQCRVWVEKKWQKIAGGNFKQKGLDAASHCWLHFDPAAAEALNKRDLEGLGSQCGKWLQMQNPGGMQRQSPVSDL